jgi:hypothetical protein
MIGADYAPVPGDVIVMNLKQAQVAGEQEFSLILRLVQTRPETYAIAVERVRRFVESATVDSSTRPSSPARSPTDSFGHVLRVACFSFAPRH